MMRTLILTLFICLSGILISQTVYFEKTFGYSWSDFSQSIREFPDGSIYIGGYSDSASAGGAFDPCISKLDKYGNWLWTKHYTSPENDYGFSLTVLSDEKIILVGEINVGGANDLEVLLIKVDSSGNLIWKKSFGGPGSQSVEYCDTTNDGNIVLCGYATSANGDLDELLIKTDTAGNIIWQKTHGGSGTEYGDFVKQTSDGGFISSAVTSSFGGGSTDGWILKLDAMGDTVWTRTSGDQYAGGCQGVCVMQDGSYVLFGEEENYTGSWFNFWLAKYDTGGNLKWKKNWGGAGSDALFTVIEANNKGFYCCGYSNSYNGQGPLDLIILKTDSMGNMTWKKTYGGSGIDIAYDMITSNQGGFLMTGQTEDPVLQSQYFVVHVDTLGNVTGVPGSTELLNFSVFPNPATDYIQINSETTPEWEIELYDARGKMVCRTISNNKTYRLTVKDYESGIYLLKIKTDKGEGLKKLIIQSVEH